MGSWETELSNGDKLRMRGSGLVVTVSNMMIFINTIINMLKWLNADELLSALKGTGG